MSLASGTKFRVDTEMDLDILILEPAAASPLQMRGLGHAAQTEHASVERLGKTLSASGHGQLDMIYRHDGHGGRLGVAGTDLEPVSPSYRNRVPKV